jgi:predicted permease
MQTLWQDVRYGLRMLGKSPGFAATAVITLALGIGANTSIFSLLNAVMLQSIPVRHPEQLVVLRWSLHSMPEDSEIGFSGYGDCEHAEWKPPFAGCGLSYAVYQAIRAQVNAFSNVLAMAGTGPLNLSGSKEARLVHGELVSGNYFDTLGVSATLGRTLEPSDDRPGAPPVAVLSFAFWQSAFGKSSDILGKKIRLNGAPFTIIGVIDARFTRLTPGKSHDLWIPLSQADALSPERTGQRFDAASSWWLVILGRLKPGASLTRAQAATNLVFRNEVLHGSKPLLRDRDDPTVTLLPAQKGLVGIRQYYDTPIYILTAAVGIVLLIACANIAALMLARATAREKEMAVRLALGAARARLIQQLLTESVLLSVAGASLGIVFAYWGAEGLAAFIATNQDPPLFIDAHPDAMVLAFTAGLALLTGILFGLAPAFRGSGVNVTPALKENSASGSSTTKAASRRFGLGSFLVVAQVALSLVVLIGAGLVVRTLANLRGVDPGFDTRNVLLFGLNPKLAGYKDEKIQALYRELQTRLASVPGIVSASYSSLTLLDSSQWTSGVHIEGQPEKSTVVTNMLAVGPSFFETMRLPLLVGRTFSQSDVQSGRPVAIVNQTFVRRFLQNRNPIGLHLGTGPNNKKIEREIVGVVADAKYDDLRKAVEAAAYIPLQEDQAYFALRTSTKPEALIPTVRHIVASLDENLPLSDITTQTETIDRLLFNERLVARLSSLFGGLALILASVGLYGLLSYEVARRTREIGIRTALGAQRRDVFRLVLGQGLILAIIGAVTGVAAAIGVTRYLGSLLYGVRPTDPATFLVIAFMLISVALLACYIPSRRATRVDPLVALRYE